MMIHSFSVTGWIDNRWYERTRNEKGSDIVVLSSVKFDENEMVLLCKFTVKSGIKRSSVTRDAQQPPFAARLYRYPM